MGLLRSAFAPPTFQGYAVVDLETTGLSPYRNRVLEVGVVHVSPDGRVTDEWGSLVNPGQAVGATHIHGMTAADVAAAPTFAQVAPGLLGLMRGRVVVAHNAKFDAGFLLEELTRAGTTPPGELPVLCTMIESRHFLPHLERRTLAACCAATGVTLVNAHSALADAHAGAQLLSIYLRRHRAARQPRWKQAAQMAGANRWPLLPDRPGSTYTRAHGARDRAITEAAPAAEAAELAAREAARRAGAVTYLASARQGLPLSGVDDATDTYLQLLDEALEDRVLTETETADLADAAAMLGLSKPRIAAANRLYLSALAGAIVADGRIDPEERADLALVAKLLRVRKPSSGEMLEAATLVHHSAPGEPTASVAGVLGRSTPLRPGQKVLIHGQTAVPAADLTARALRAGLEVVAAARGCVDVLVIADPDGARDRAEWARARGVRVLIEPVFLALLDQLEHPPAQRPAVAAVSDGAGDTTPASEGVARARDLEGPQATHLSPGQNITLSPLLAGPAVRLELTWDASSPIDADVCAIVQRAGAMTDEDLIFYNQTSHPSGAVRLRGKVSNDQRLSDSLEVDLHTVPEDTNTIVLGASADGDHIARMGQPRLEVIDPATATVVAVFTLPVATTERAMVCAELYRRNEEWKVRAVGAGYDSGLAGLVIDYGFTIEA